MTIDAFIFTGTHPGDMEHEDTDYLSRPEAMPQDYAWRALGEHIAQGPSRVPSVVDAEVAVRGKKIRARAYLSYVVLDDSGNPVANDQETLDAVRRLTEWLEQMATLGGIIDHEVTHRANHAELRVSDLKRLLRVVRQINSTDAQDAGT